MSRELYKFPFRISNLLPKIFELEPFWTKRHDTLPFWTLGRASYKDFHLPEYYECAEATNRILYDAFPNFYNEQLWFFETMLKAPVKYMKGVSLPGFHIFKSCEEFTRPMARPHVDIPYDNFEWGKTVDMDQIFTHVIPVALPSDGAGMNVWWNYGVKDIAEFGVDNCLALLQSAKPDVIEHQVDMMLFHSGKFFHQIEPFRSHRDGEWRITLQSHAMKKDGTWYLYW